MALQNSRRTQRQREAGPRKGEIREAQILDATEQLLASTSFGDLTMDDIAQEAGLSRSATYFYFASKEAVLGALHERMYEAMAKTTEPLRDPHASPASAMRDAIERVNRNWRNHTDALRTFHETAMATSLFGEQWRERLERHVTVLAEFIERERDAGRAAPAPPSARAIASAWFWMLEQQFYELYRRKHARADEAELIDTLTVLWVRCVGLTPDADEPR